MVISIIKLQQKLIELNEKMMEERPEMKTRKQNTTKNNNRVKLEEEKNQEK